MQYRNMRISLLLTVLALFGPCIAQAKSLDAQLEDAASRSAAVISILHRKAEKALVNVAQDNAFGAYFTSHDDAHRHHHKARIDEISLNVQSDFHVEEMCLIDPSGSEISRIVGSKIAHDLSHEEASASFFEPSFAQRFRSVYVAPAYVSPDVDRWVVAYVTPIVVEDDKKAILHYEHGLDVYQNALQRLSAPAGVIRLAVTDEGWIVWDSRKSVDIAKVDDSEDPSDYFDQFRLGDRDFGEILAAAESDEPIVDADGRRYRIAARQVKDWYLIAYRTIDSDLVSQAED